MGFLRTALRQILSEIVLNMPCISVPARDPQIFFPSLDCNMQVRRVIDAMSSFQDSIGNFNTISREAATLSVWS